MLTTILIIILCAAAVFFAWRWLTLRRALRNIREELTLVRQDLTQNQMLHLPLPDATLSALLDDLNALLADIQQERQTYARHERAFQEQIEAISHDLRTPLTVILGNLKLFKNTQQAQIARDPELAETVAVIEQKAEAMKLLVAQFYDYSRLAADDMALSLTRVDAGRCLREALAGNYQLLQDADLALEVTLPEHPLWALADEAALARVFQNLLQNAGRYAKSRLVITADEKPEQLLLTFANDTTDLSPSDTARLFERFYTPDASRHQGSEKGQGGTGLGLTVARTLAREMQGDLSAELTPTRDTEGILCFTLSLKRA